MTLDDLNEFIRNTVTSITGVPESIEYFPNAPRPASDYATVYIARVKKIGFADKKQTTELEDLSEKVAMVYNAFISINFFKGDALQNAGILSGSMNGEAIVSSFNAEGIGFIEVSEPRDLSQLINQGYEKRAQVDLTVQFELTPIPETVTGVDTVIVTGDIDNGNQVVETVDISITN